MRKWILIPWLILIFSAISFLFWHNEFKYSLPTPVPAKYQPVENGTVINVSNKVHAQNNKPVFFHFFNPDCPCSRFNIGYFKSLVTRYKDRVNFNIVVLSANKNYTAKEIQEKFDIAIPVFFDSSIAVACGVYSTPQAALIDNNGQLYYRGNYNRSRYCTDRNSNFAQMAIDSLLLKIANPFFTLAATKSYGCSLPACTR